MLYIRGVVITGIFVLHSRVVGVQVIQRVVVVLVHRGVVLHLKVVRVVVLRFRVDVNNVEVDGGVRLQGVSMHHNFGGVVVLRIRGVVDVLHIQKEDELIQ